MLILENAETTHLVVVTVATARSRMLLLEETTNFIVKDVNSSWIKSLGTLLMEMKR
jgi:hypothetical protein